MFCKHLPLALLAAGLLLGTTGCKDDDAPEPANEEELITTVRLTLTPTGSSSSIVVEWQDLDGDGGSDPTVDNLTLVEDQSYTYTIEFLNEAESPTEDITEEIEEEADEHQVFYFVGTQAGAAFGDGGNVTGNIAVTDTDSRGCQLGLAGTVTFENIGTTTLRAVLRHQPGSTGKESVNCSTTPGGNVNLGSTDVDVAFPLTVIANLVASPAN
ncbi:MAG: type 1 periplasmic binding fold superfamily protein [Bacteroidia bacterium]|nr:type 1 periplasmic binding fold superfamily protein [Bacteroidia bacterium]